jgi:hypothetical protein
MIILTQNLKTWFFVDRGLYVNDSRDLVKQAIAISLGSNFMV